MPTEKRQRKKQGRQARLEAERAAAARAHRRRRIISAVLVALLVVGVLTLISASGGDDEDDQAATTTTEAEAEGPEPVEPECPPDEKPAEPVLAFTEAPPDCLEAGVDYRAIITTSEGGEIAIDLFEERAPTTVNNFVFLARWGYYDGDDFHRVVENFVIQGGDPVGDPPGTGGPGYQIEDELPEPDDYQAGSLAMANSGPDTNGSQFFIVTSDEGASNLVQAAGGEAAYSLFGQVTDGMDVVATVEAGPVTGPQNDQPADPVTIESIEIVES